MEQEVQTQFVTAGSLLYSVEHRPWLPPDGPWLLSQRWNDVLFAHFAMEPGTLRRLVPEAMTLELYDGAAWLTLTPSCASHVRPSGIPALPGFSFYPQVNVRTYVTVGGKPGLYNFSVDAANLSAVWFARMFFHMQYWHSKIKVGRAPIPGTKTGATVHFRAGRLHGPTAHSGAAKLDIAYAAEGEAEVARAGSLDHFLTERYCVYSWHGRKIYRAELHHQPWPLQRASAEIRTNSIAEPLGITLPQQPDLCHFSRTLKTLAWAPERVREAL